MLEIDVLEEVPDMLDIGRMAMTVSAMVLPSKIRARR
jgi:hypothetical protein